MDKLAGHILHMISREHCSKKEIRFFNLGNMVVIHGYDANFQLMLLNVVISVEGMD